MSEVLLQIKNLGIDFDTEEGRARAVDRISFDIKAGETVGLVGESGCGKSITSLSILGLVPQPPGIYVPGSSISYRGQELIGLSEREYQRIRGHEISMIFQEPMTALNPVQTVEKQMTDVLRRHKKLSRKQALLEATVMLETVGIPDPARRIKDYPHQLSGGMRQRVMIAMALSCDPSLLLADEPTTALDVTVQAQVMEEMSKLQKQRGMATLLVTHDLAVIAEFCEKVVVMYCGKIVEIGSVEEIFANPQHPYTHGLLKSIPRIRDQKIDRLPTIPGTVPDLFNLPQGCRFKDRCEKASGSCSTQPELEKNIKGGQVACFHPYEQSMEELA